MALRQVSLNDRFDLSKKEVLLSGVQALVRLTMMQKQRDQDKGLNTAGYVTGYRGSPLGTVDQQFWRARKILEPLNIKFEAGLNEDLAATALWGSQQSEMRGEGKFDGVFGMWYGKGPGVDRCGDVFRHANAAGTSRNGGVLVLMGDDHHAESSTVPHQSEFALLDAMMPILHPAGVQEILDFGIIGLAMSRYSGCWVGLKCVHDNVESSAVVDGSYDRIKIKEPKDYSPPEGGLNIRPADDRHQQEVRLHHDKRFAAVAMARANKVDQIVYKGGDKPKIGIISTGKSYLDCRQALENLAIDEKMADSIGLKLLKVGMVWPLDPEIIEEFAKGLQTILVVEEKRSLIESQVREQLYGRKNSPVIIGKKDENGEELFPAYGVLGPNKIALAFAKRLGTSAKRKKIANQIEKIETAISQVRNRASGVERIPYFCAGCPHNSSTVLPENARGYAGIGCHWMVQFIPERNTEGATHMGGEGANWIGEAPFSTRDHVFQNLGDGTYNHSGNMAIRAAVASGVNITFKILYNDAVAMTGGQTHEGDITVQQIANEVSAMGVSKLVVVSDEPEKYPTNSAFPSGTQFFHRDDLDELQKDLMDISGVSVMIYDQTCAAEKRRRRKRGLYPDPAKRAFINELVCEGCGDCGVQSNCVAIAPVETEFGRKRKIDQSMCNKDFSCLEGFCPSFVTVEGGELRRGQRMLAVAEEKIPFEVLPDPEMPSLEKPWSIQLTGIGGTGVVTTGAILAMAAHLEGKGTASIDMAGLSQKNGAVVTHLKIAKRPEDIQAIRIASGSTDLLLGCDLVTSASERILSLTSKERTHSVINTYETMPAMFTRQPNFELGSEDLKFGIEVRSKPDNCHFVNATKIATALLGDSIAANLFTLGYAYQKGLIPVSAEAIEGAIKLDAVAIDMNTKAFMWGRRTAHNQARVEEIITPQKRGFAEQTLDEIIERRVQFLTDYQDAEYASKYKSQIDQLRTKEDMIDKGSQDFAKTVAKSLFKLMAIKDEYEVARLYTTGEFERRIKEQFTGDYALKFHLAPPILTKIDPKSGLPKKQTFGPWMMSAFKILAKMKGFRGTFWDIFGRTEERMMERQLLADYKITVDKLVANLTMENLPVAIEIANLPQKIRGFGHVKHKAVMAYEEELKALWVKFENPEKAKSLAAE